LRSDLIKQIAHECGFELSGVCSADPPDDFARYQTWASQGMAGEMGYLTDRRGDLRRDVRNLLPSAKSVICVGKLYNQRSTPAGPEQAAISRYAWGRDYHDVMREDLERMAARLGEHASFEWKACVDTAPVLERTFARLAGLGWIGKNTCLINEPQGSWFFLGELITSLEIDVDAPPPERCGTCTRCIDACPTDAFVPAGEWWSIDARRCIAYFTIELRGPIPEEHRAAMANHVFGCDICQDVCPWNSRAPLTEAFEHTNTAPDLETLSALSETEFREMFRESPLARPKHSGFLRNVAIAMGNSGLERFREPLERLAKSEDPLVAEHARWALERLGRSKAPR
jgi:epoxyqueuosine reductase